MTVMCWLCCDCVVSKFGASGRGTVADAELCEVVVSNKKWTAMTSAPAAVGVAAKFEAK